jgi:hypothetical protein
MKEIFRNFGWILALFFGSFLLISGILPRYWLKSLEKKHQRISNEFGQTLGVELFRGRIAPQDLYREWIGNAPEVGYVVMTNLRTGYRSGLVNTGELSRGASEVVEFFKSQGNKKTLERLVQKEKGFPSEHLDVYAISIFPPPFDRVSGPLGIVKIGYVIPGYPYGRGFQKLWWIVSGVMGLLFFLSIGLWGIAVRSPIGVEPPPTDKAELKELEEAMEEPSTAGMDEEGREWTWVFDGKGFDGWRLRGDVYITEREMALQPWASSAVLSQIVLSPKFHFQCKAKRIAGTDAFIFLFPANGKNLIWVVGGWENDRAEVLGYPNTAHHLTIDRFAWYKIELRVEEDVVGLINDLEIFRLQKLEVTTHSPDCGFQQGLGVATWNTFSKFKDILYLAL